MGDSENKLEKDGVLRYWTDHDITVTGYTEWNPPQAEIDVWRWPGGSPKNSLTADELREVAAGLEVMADELEGPQG